VRLTKRNDLGVRIERLEADMTVFWVPVVGFWDEDGIHIVLNKEKA